MNEIINTPKCSACGAIAPIDANGNPNRTGFYRIYGGILPNSPDLSVHQTWTIQNNQRVLVGGLGAIDLCPNCAAKVTGTGLIAIAASLAGLLPKTT